MAGRLIAFEGLDQSGKQTQAEWLAEALRAAGHRVQMLSFPDYATTIGAEIGAALHGQRAYGPDVLQLLYIANRYEHAPAIRGWLAEGTMVVADRYAASSLAYGEAQGLDAGVAHRRSAAPARRRSHAGARHRAEPPRWRASTPHATGSNATCRCCRACGTATGARPPRRPGT